MHQHQREYHGIMHNRPEFPSSFEFWSIYIYELIFENYVSKEKVDQQERQNQWGQEEVCNAQKSKKQDPGDLPMESHIWNFKFISLTSLAAAATAALLQ